MSRIDANVATQIADVSRPLQIEREGGQQAADAQRLAATQTEPNGRQPVNAQELRATAQRMQQVIEAASGRQLDFKVNDQFNELVVQVSDRKTGEMIKQIPSKEMLKLRERINDLIGMFIDKTA